MTSATIATERELEDQDRPDRYALSFESWNEYQKWENDRTANAPNGPEDARRRFWEMADLIDSLEEMNPYERPRFTASFNSFEEYEAWKNEQTNPWNW